MKKLITIIAIGFCVFLSQNVQAQGEDLYLTSGGEWIFSWGGTGSDGPVRWSPVFNFQFNLNKDFSDMIGVYTGIAIRNVGYIRDESGDVRFKYRTYNLGIPVGLKVGNRNGFMMFGGYEFELPFHYKEKRFENEIKEKFTVYFSDRVNKIQHSVFAGIQLYSGTNLKFKYYLTNFHNKSYRESDGNQPYADWDSNVFYISLNFDLFRNSSFYYKEVDKNISTARL